MSEPSPQSVYNSNIATLAGIQKTAEERYDAILTTLGSAFLALSISFLKDVVPLQDAQCLWLLYLSWGLFAVTIISTVLSLGFGPKAVAWHASNLTPDRYPAPGLERQNPWNKAIGALNGVSGLSFILGVVLTVVFVIINTVQWRSEMDKRVPPHGETKGLTIPPMQTGTQKPANAPAGDASPPPASSPPQQSSTGTNSK